MNRIPIPLRWILVLPGAIVAFFIIQIINSLGATFANVPDWMIQLFNSWASSFAIVVAGAYIAPKRRPIVATILAVVYVLVIAVATTLAIAKHVEDSPWWLILNGVISLIGSVVACVVCWDKKSMAALSN